MKCTCTYKTLINRGFHPIDHAWNCPLNTNYVEEEKFKFDRTKYRIDKVTKGNSPYNAVENKELGFDRFLNSDDKEIFDKKWNK